MASPSPGPPDTVAAGAPRAYRLRAVLFDFDGTLTEPDALDFPAAKRDLGCPPEQLLLEWVQSLPPGERRATALAGLEAFELAGARRSRPNRGAEALVRRLRDGGLKIGVLTRNGLAAVTTALTRFPDLRLEDFDVVVTRDHGAAPKPAPDGVLHAAQAMGVPPDELLVVGDFELDMQAGRAAGAVTAFLTNRDLEAAGDGGGASTAGAAELPAVETTGTGAGVVQCDVVVHGLDELDDVIWLGLPLPAGKLPGRLLAPFLDGVAGADPTVLVPAGIGEDVAALDVTAVDTLVAHGDPITLTGEQVGSHAVLVNLNDIAASGADPRWLLATVLLPEGTTPSKALAVLHDMAGAARDSGVSLVGGHTEVTAAVTMPLVSLTALGTVARGELRDKRDVQTGDHLILTKALAVEGTVLLADEAGDRLRTLGMDDAELAACRELRPLLSVVSEARIAAGFAGVRALHDVTEGGLATAVRELAQASGHGVHVRLDLVPVLPLTRRVCDLLGADPLGLIASGSLLLTSRPQQSAAVLAALAVAGIQATTIGEIGERGAGATAEAHGRPGVWPEFAVDEAARLLTGGPRS